VNARAFLAASPLRGVRAFKLSITQRKGDELRGSASSVCRYAAETPGCTKTPHWAYGITGIRTWQGARVRSGNLLLDEPTQGVDFGARCHIFLRIVDVAESGVTVVYSSTEAQDLAELGHRVLVLRDGVVAGILQGRR